MHNPLPRLWRACLPFMFLAAGILLLLAAWPDRIPTAGSARNGSAFSLAKHAPWIEGGPLRVGSPEPERQATVLSPYGPGFEFELVSGFCRGVRCTPEWVTVTDKNTGFAMLQRGEIDVLVGFWGDPPSKQEAPPPKAPSEDTASEDAASEHDPPPIAKGKAYAHFNPVRISGATVPRQAEGAPGDNREPLPNLSSVGAAFAWTYSAFPPSAPSAPSEGDQAPASPTGAAENGQPFPVFSFVMDGKGDGTDTVLLDPASYALWLPFMGDVDIKKLNRKTPYRWFWRDDDSALAARLETFWKDPERNDELAELTERYFGFLPRALQQQDILNLAEALATRLPRYEEFIMKAARETGVPPLLLVATIYQESKFDPEAVSETKVRGIMQLTTATAAMLGVDRNNPEQCIMGGARYLRDLWERVGDKATNDWDRWFMALAAYNQGLSNVNRTIRLAQEMGKKGDSWADLKQIFPLSTTCRGGEAKAFVERVRYYNFILHGLVALAPAEAQDFAPLLGLAVADAKF